MLVKLLAVAVGGILMGLVPGYFLGARENATLAEELARTKSWLIDEINRTDATTRASEAGSASEGAREVQKARAALRAVQSDLASTRARLKEAVDDWKTERQRRRNLEAKLATRDGDCGDAKPTRR